METAVSSETAGSSKPRDVPPQRTVIRNLGKESPSLLCKHLPSAFEKSVTNFSDHDNLRKYMQSVKIPSHSASPLLKLHRKSVNRILDIKVCVLVSSTRFLQSYFYSNVY